MQLKNCDKYGTIIENNINHFLSMNIKQSIIFFPLFLISLFFVEISHGFFENNNKSDSQAESDKREFLEFASTIYDAIDEMYIEKLPVQKLKKNFASGFLHSLDPHSAYMTRQDIEDAEISSTGEFAGIGVEIISQDNAIQVVSAIEDTPAFKAGIQSGDYIVSIDGQSAIGMSLNQAVKKMRGKPGTDIVLTIVRDKETEPQDIRITRDIVRIIPVKHRMEGLYADIAYIRVTVFNEQTTPLVEEAFNELINQNPSLKGIILDLRNNPGGLMDEAIFLSDLFLDDGIIVTTRSRYEDDIIFDASSGDIADELPIIVLINGGSASASEIVAGALKYNYRGVVVGEKSFGKGSVQVIREFDDEEDGAIKITIARYYTPNNVSIQARGIEPNIVVKQMDISKKKASYTTHNESSLIDHLKSSAKYKENKIETNKDTEYYEDNQLSHAIDILYGIHYSDLKKTKG